MEENTLTPAQAEINQLVENGVSALDEFLKLNQDQVDYIVAKCSVAALDAHGELAKLAIEETGRGIFEDHCQAYGLCAGHGAAETRAYGTPQAQFLLADLCPGHLRPGHGRL